MKIRVYYEDTDCGGIVYHANYLKYCERARSELFFSENLLPQSGTIGLVVKSMSVDFVASARLGDELEVSTNLLSLGKCSLNLEQEIYLQSKLIFKAEVKLACIDVCASKPCKIPQELLQIINKFPLKNAESKNERNKSKISATQSQTSKRRRGEGESCERAEFKK